MNSQSPASSASDLLAIERGCWFDPVAAERPILFIEKWCRQSQGRWNGKPLALLDWQKDFISRLFGWKAPDGFRRYRTAYLEVAKKNGKSTMLSALVLYLLLADGEGAPKIFLNACDREQASIIFDEAAAMVDASPELSRRLEVLTSKKRITHPAGNGRIQANSAEAPNKDGANSSAIIFDELHRQKTRDLWDMFEYAGVSREQPIKISITTAGDDEHGVWFEQREYSEKVNRGEIPDTTHLGVIYRAEETDDIDSRETWIKANPSLGTTIKFDDFERELTKAKQSQAELALFRRLRLNIITRTESRLFSPEQWRACDSPAIDPEDFLGKPCWMGYDGAENTDLAAVVTLFGDDDSHYDVLARFWMAEDRVDFLAKKDRVPYRQWIEKGFIEAVPGDLIGKKAIRREILSQSSMFRVRKIGFDPWKAIEFFSSLMEDDGLEAEELRQGYATLAAPTARLEAMVIGKLLRHGANPVLRWMAGNAIAKEDENGNHRLDKEKSRSRIDGMAALVNAIAVMMSDPDAGESVYESRGILIL